MLSQYLVKKVRFAGLFLLFSCHSVVCQDVRSEDRVSALSVYARTSDNTFTEYGKDDFIYNEEKGAIDYLGFAFYWQFDSGVFIETGSERGKGSIDWKGYLQNFDYAVLETEYLLTKHYIHLGRNFGSNSAYVGVGSRYRERNIINGTLYEELDWIFATFGIGKQFRLSQRWRLNFKGDMAISLNAQQNVEFAGHFDPVTIKPGKIATGSGTVELEFRLTPKFAVSIAPTYEFSSINKGDSYDLKTNGVKRAVAHQPKTEYETIYWQLKLQKLF